MKDKLPHFLLVLSLIALNSCSKKDSCDEGAVFVLESNCETHIQLRQGSISYSGNGFLYVYTGLDEPMTTSHTIGFADVGTVESLCEIEGIPSSDGFRLRVDLIKGHGIIVKERAGDGQAIYDRIYVEDLIQKADKGVPEDGIPTQATLRIQKNWRSQ